MPASNFLSHVGTSIRLFRKPRRRKALRNSVPGLISSENRLEDRILLSATTVDDRLADVPVDYDALIDAIADDVEAEHVDPFQESINNAIDTYVANTADPNAAFETANALEGSPIEDGLGTYVNDLNEAENELTNEAEQAQPDTDTTDVGNGTASDEYEDEEDSSVFDSEGGVEDLADDLLGDMYDEDGDEEEEFNVEYENGYETGYSVGVLAALEGKPQKPELTDSEASADFHNGYELGYLAGYASIPVDDDTDTPDDTNTDDDDTGTDGTTGEDGEENEPADPRFHWTTFAFRDQFEDITLPVESRGSLFDVQPEGAESYSGTTVTTAEPVSEATPEGLGTGTKTTNATTEVTLEQQVTSPTEWVVTQSWNRQLSSDEKSTDSDGDNQDFDRAGTEGLSISVINGTTTVMTYSVSDTFSYSSGEIEGFDDSAPAESWTVPQNWVDTASYPEEKDEEAEGKGDEKKEPLPGDGEEGGSEGGEEEKAEDEEDGNPNDSSQGARYMSTASLTITVTTRLLTLEDGRTGQSTTISWNASRSFTSLIAGRYSVSDRVGTLTSWSLEDADDENAGDGGEDSEGTTGDLIQLAAETADNSEELPDVTTGDIASGGNGHSFHASGEFFAFGHASVTFGGGITVTVMDDGSAPPATPAGSATFGLSLGSGAFNSQSVNVQLQESSGDSYEYLSSSDTSTNGGAGHFSYTVTAPLGELRESNTGTTAEPEPEPEDTTADDTGVTSVLSFGNNSHHSSSQSVSHVQHIDQDEPTFRTEGTDTFQASSTKRGTSGIGYQNEIFTKSASSYDEQDIRRTSSGNSWHQTGDNSEVTADYSRSVGAYLLNSSNDRVTAGDDDVVVTSDYDFEVDIHDSGHHRLDGLWTETDDAGQPVATHTGVYETRAAFTYGGQADPDSEFDPTTTWTATNSRNGNPAPADLPLSDELLLDLLLADITATRDLVLTDSGTTDGTADTTTTEVDSNTGTVETDTSATNVSDDGADTEIEFWLEDRDAAEALLTTSDDNEGADNDDETTGEQDNTDDTGPGGVPDGGHVDPNTSHVYDADGNLVGKLSEDGNVYWPADWDENGPVEMSGPPVLRRHVYFWFGHLSIGVELLNRNVEGTHWKYLHFAPKWNEAVGGYYIRDNQDWGDTPVAIVTTTQESNEQLIELWKLLEQQRENWDPIHTWTPVHNCWVPVLQFHTWGETYSPPAGDWDIFDPVGP